MEHRRHVWPWLVGMNQKRHVWSWLGGILLLPVVYLLSFIPLAWVFNHDLITPDPNGWVERIASIYAAPVQYADDHGPRLVQEFLEAYHKFLRKL